MSESDASKQASLWFKQLEQALQTKDIAGVTALFNEECYWRDLVAFTWNIKTQEGHEAIAAMLNSQLDNVQPSNFQLDGEASEADGVIEAWFSFETASARGRGLLRLQNGKAWTLLTSMDELKGFEENRKKKRPLGAQHGIEKNRKTWMDKKVENEQRLGYEDQPYCLIIGGGQGGITMGARLKQLNVPTIVIEKNERAGDSWRKRYKSLCLHDPVWYDHLPYIPFPENWPVFSPKDKIGDWLEMYTRVMELNYWTSTACENASYDDDKQEWSVKVNRDGEEVTLHPKQLILATGMSAVPNIPDIPGMDSFKGSVHHSSRHGGGGDYTGKKVLVLGANNSAHDICADLWENDADVTMIQRSSTHIAPVQSLMELALGGLYSEEAVANGIDHHKADLIFASVPYRIMHSFHIPVYDEMKKRDADLYERLEKAGFMLDFGDDGSGLFMKYLRRGSGYYIDIGASDLVANGDVKLKSGVSIAEIKPNSAVLSDGTELEADVIVLATGYGSMNGWAGQLINQAVADKVGKCWGLGSDTTKDPGPWEGELRNMWKPNQQENLWFHGGNLHQSRHYSQYLSLQIKARMEGLETPVYGMTEPHHLS